MKIRQTVFWTALAAFAGGYASWRWLAPRSEQALRDSLAAQARASSGWMGTQWQAAEAQLAALEAEVETAGRAFSDKVRSLTQNAFDPLTFELSEAWQLERGEVARELRHLPRR